MQIDNKIEIENLINRYFEGNTSSLEEEILQDYFRKEDIDEDFLQYRSLFNALGDLSAQSELMEINSLFIENQYVNFITKKSILKKYLRISATAIAGIAACIVLFFTTYYPKSPDTFVIINGKKYTDKIIIQNAFDASIESVRVDLDDVFSDLHDVVMEDD